MRTKLSWAVGSALVLGVAFVACGGVNPGEIVILDDEPSAGRGGSVADAGAGNGDSGAAGATGEAGEGGEGGQVPSQPGPPRVVRVAPEDMSNAASPTQAIIITFSEPLLAGSVTAQSVQVKNSAGVTSPGALSYQNAVVRFTPQGRLTLEAEYTVSVSTAVQDTEGTALADAFASSFVVRAGAWTPAAPLSTTDAGNSAPVLASDGKGHALAVWARQQKPGTAAHDVVGKLFTPGAGWGAEVVLDSSGADALEPAVAMNASGDAVVAWLEGGSHIAARRYTAGAWEPAALPVSAVDDKAVVTGVSAAIGPMGTAHVSWLQRVDGGASSHYTYTRYARSGTAWEGSPQLLSVIGQGSDSELPALAFDQNSDAMAVYCNGADGSVSSARYFEGGGGWEMQGGLPGAEANALGPASLASDGTGLMIAVWPANNPGTTAIQASLYKSGWLPSVTLSSSSENDSPSIHWTGKKFIALWRSKTDDTLLASELGIDLKPAPVPVSGALHDVGSYAFASDGFGNALAVWAHAAQNRGVLSFSRLPSGASAWSAPATLSEGAEARGFPALALHRDGSANGVWAALSDSPNAPVVTGIAHAEFQ